MRASVRFQLFLVANLDLFAGKPNLDSCILFVSLNCIKNSKPTKDSTVREGGKGLIALWNCE